MNRGLLAALLHVASLRVSAQTPAAPRAHGQGLGISTFAGAQPAGWAPSLPGTWMGPMALLNPTPIPNAPEAVPLREALSAGIPLVPLVAADGAPAAPSAQAQLDQAAQPVEKGPDPVAALFDGMRTDAPEAAFHALDEKTVNDLELFAPETGLYALVNRTTTSFSAKRLKWLLSHPYLDAGEIRRRQEAVQALGQGRTERQAVDAAFARLGQGAQDSLWSHFRNPPPLRPLVVSAHVAQAMLTGMGAVFLAAAGWKALPQIAFIWLVLGGNPVAQLQKRRAELANYKAAFQAARRLAPALAGSDSPALRELGARLIVDGPGADPRLARAAASLRRLGDNWWMLVSDTLWFQGAKTLPHLARRLKQARAQVAGVFGALAEVDAYRSLALYREAHEGDVVMPRVEPGPARLSIEGGNHPYLALKARSVPNDVDLAVSPTAKNFAVLTGSNMGGKSTYLRMSALLSLLAQTGSWVPARAMALPPLKLITSIDIRDNLASGKSLYDAETDRALALVRSAQGGPGHLIVMDEILQGTNPEESSAAQRGIVRFLVNTQNLFILATHNPQVAELETLEPGIANLHVEERIEDGRMSFSHKVLPGPAVSRNGLMTLEVKGFPDEILAEARRQIQPKP